MEALLKELQTVLWEVYPKSLEEWEDVFHREANPEHELKDWADIAGFYRDCTEGTQLSIDEKRAIFKLALHLAIAPEDKHESVLSKLDLKALNREKARDYLALWQKKYRRTVSSHFPTKNSSALPEQ